MSSVREELVKMLNRGLELEYAARIQYLAHAELLKGIYAEPVIERLKEIAGDEQKHEDKFRTLIAGYLNGVPSMSLAAVHEAKTEKEILSVNLKGETEAIDYYKKIYQFASDNKKEFQYSYEKIEHELRHIIMDEEEHVIELSLLLGQ